MAIVAEPRIKEGAAAPPQLSREEEIIAFFVNQCSGALGRTQLMKFVYLADYEARRFLGRPLSNVTYIWHNYGPWDQELYARLARLQGLQVIRESRVSYPSGREGFLYERGGVTPSWSFTPAEVEILSYVCREYSSVPLQQLLEEIVYETEPMRFAQEHEARGRALNMDMVNGTGSAALGLPFEELLARRAEARAGRTISHADFMAALG